MVKDVFPEGPGEKAGFKRNDVIVGLRDLPIDNEASLRFRLATLSVGDTVPVKVMRGGPVETERGFVLHSADFFIENSTLPIDDGICLTATLDVLKAIAKGDGPGNALLALGYAGWAPGQLETEIQDNGWLHCGADPDLIFGPDIGNKYDRALRKLGINVGMLSSEAGHA